MVIIEPDAFEYSAKCSLYSAVLFQQFNDEKRYREALANYNMLVNAMKEGRNEAIQIR